MSVPRSILPPCGSSVMLHWIGTAAILKLERLAGAEHGRLDLEDVLRGLDDDQVGAALDQAPGLLGEHLDELGELDLPESGVVAGREEARRTDRAGDEAILTGGLAGDLGGLDVDLERVVLEPPLGELQPRGLEGVGLDDVGAGRRASRRGRPRSRRDGSARAPRDSARGACSRPRGSARTARAWRPCRRRRRPRARGGWRPDRASDHASEPGEYLDMRRVKVRRPGVSVTPR